MNKLFVYMTILTCICFQLSSGIKKLEVRKFTVYNSTGPNYSIIIDPNETVLDIKKEISRKSGIPIENITLGSVNKF